MMFAAGGVEDAGGVRWAAARRSGTLEEVDGDVNDGRGEDRRSE